MSLHVAIRNTTIGDVTLFEIFCFPSEKFFYVGIVLNGWVGGIFPELGGDESDCLVKSGNSQRRAHGGGAVRGEM